MLKLAKYSVGVGDRFAQQAEAQLRALILAAENGAEIVPVWNKSNREHLVVDSEPPTVKAAAEAAVRELGWKKRWHGKTMTQLGSMRSTATKLLMATAPRRAPRNC